MRRRDRSRRQRPPRAPVARKREAGPQPASRVRIPAALDQDAELPVEVALGHEAVDPALLVPERVVPAGPVRRSDRLHPGLHAPRDVRKAGSQDEPEQAARGFAIDDGRRQQAARKQPRAARRHSYRRRVQGRHGGRHIVQNQFRARSDASPELRPPLLDLCLQPAAIVGNPAFADRLGDAPPLLVAQILPVERIDEQGEAIRQRGIQRLRPGVILVAVLVRRTRVHRRPAVAQLRQADALHPPLVDERKQPVLLLGLAAADLVDQDRFRAPHGGRRFEKPYARPLGIGIGKAHQVVERDQAGVVVPMLEVQRFRQRVEQVRLARA